MEGKPMKIKTRAENRKDVVKAMEEILNVRAEYQGPPTFQYHVGDYTVDRDGCVEHESEEKTLEMQSELAARGLAYDKTADLMVELPLDGHTAESLKNLIYMIHSKQYLLEKSMGMTVLKVSDRLVERLEAEKEATIEQVMQTVSEEDTSGIAFAENRIRFGEFPAELGNASVYTMLISKMVKAAKEAKRVNPKETVEENEKYYMRTWLVRIGLDGKDTKEVRKVLLGNLKGHSAFRTEADRIKWQEKNCRKSAPKGDEE
jgi:hypothetical protein